MSLRNEKVVAAICDYMIKMFGAPTVNVILQRAVWETGQQMPGAGLLEVESGRLNLAGLYGLGDEEQNAEIMGLLFNRIIETLARLIGEDLAKKVTAQLGEEG